MKNRITQESLPGEQLTPPRKRLSKKGVKTALAVSAVLALPSATGITMLCIDESDPFKAAEFLGDFAQYALGADLCNPGPNPQEQRKIRDTILGDKKSLALAQVEASLQGLSFADPTATLAAIDKSVSAQEATKHVSRYTQENFGFDLSLDMPEGTFDEPGATSHYRKNLKIFTDFTSVLPRELIKGIQLNTVSVTNTEERPNNGLLGTYMAPQANVEIDINYVARPFVFIHEVLGHGTHATACDGHLFNRDNALTQYNPDGFEYEDSGKRRAGYSSYGITATGYGGINVSEDFAETTDSFMFGDTGPDFVAAEPKSPINQKLTLAMYRFDEIAQGSAAYIIATRPYFAELELYSGDLPKYEY